MVGKCIEDKTELGSALISVDIISGGIYAGPFGHCSNCNKYLVDGKMIEDIREVGLYHVNKVSHTKYNLEDIEVERL